MSNLYPAGRQLGARMSAPVARLAAVVAGVLLLGLFAIPMKGRLEGSFQPAGRIAGAVGVPYRLGSADVSIVSIGGFRIPQPVYVGTDGQRITVGRIRRFLARQGSPMTRYSQNIVVAGLRYHVDPRVIVAIAGVESTYGRHARGHNAWGWNPGRTRWRSWAAAIDGYTRALSRQYRSLRHGRFHAASRTYCPPCGRRWGIRALRIFRQI